jgi:hypothetical protein
MIDFLEDSPSSSIEAPPSASIVPPELAAAALADAAPPAMPGAPGAAAIAAPIDYDAEAKDLIEFTWACFAPLYPSLEPIYTIEARSRISAAAAPLMRKYGVSLGVLGPELTFAITIFPLIVPTYKAIQHDNEEHTRAAAAASSSSSTSAPAAGAAAANDASAGAAGGDATPLSRFPGQT